MRKEGRGNYLPVQTGKVSAKERREATQRILAEKQVYELELMCNCSQYPFAHPAHTNELSIFNYHSSLRPGKK